MRTAIIALAALTALAAPAAAQRLGERLPGQRAEPGMPRDAGRSSDMRPCPQYGAGFVRLNGSNTCVRLGGAVRFEYGVGGGGRYRSSTGMRSGAMVELDARVETEIGPLRAVVRGGGSVDTGSMQGQRW